MFLDSILIGSHWCGAHARRNCATWLLGAALALLTSCTTAQDCEPLERCGGELLPAGQTLSSWVATGEETCTDQVQPPIVAVSLSQQPAAQAGKKFPGQATLDWCSSLAVQPDGSLHFTNFTLSQVLPMQQAELQFKADGTYFAHFLTSSPETMNFSAACRAAQGVNWSCPELGRHINASIVAESNVKYFRCQDDDQGGCTCDSLLLLFTGVQGSYGSQGGVATFYDNQSNSPPAPADYCVKPDRLELTGHEGQALFNRLGLRTITYRRATCTDGLQDAAEDGIDCTDPKKRATVGDAACPNDCAATCTDNVQNQNETGVDCGGACADFCECFNGRQDPWEEGADCGGPCSLLCTCTNGKQDANEDGIDCGGDCNLRYGDGSGVQKPCK